MPPTQKVFFLGPNGLLKLFGCPMRTAACFVAVSSSNLDRFIAASDFSCLCRGFSAHGAKSGQLRHRVSHCEKIRSDDERVASPICIETKAADIDTLPHKAVNVDMEWVCGNVPCVVKKLAFVNEHVTWRRILDDIENLVER